MMMIALLLSAFLGAPAGAQSTSSMTLRAIDLYRSDVLTYEKVRSATGHSLDNYLRLAALRKRGGDGALERLRQEVLGKLKAAAPLAYVDIGVQEYLISFERFGNVTIDVVDAKDAAIRMPFYPAPKGKPRDPEGLLALWKQYVETGEALSREGKIQASQRPACPGFYCLWGSPTPEMANMEKKLSLEAVAKRRDLLEAFRESADARQRAAALYVLSYSSSGAAVADLAVTGLRDPGEEVRSAAMQIIADLAVYHKEVPLDLDRIVAALDYPAMGDRAKALSMLVGIVDNPALKGRLTALAAPKLLALMRLKQPSNRDLAFTLLSQLSQRSFDAKDLDSWTKWVEENAPAGALQGVWSRDL